MTIGTSLGHHYQDEHHYQARDFQSDIEKSVRSQYKDPTSSEDSMIRNPLEVSPDNNPFDEMGTKEMQMLMPDEDSLRKAGSHSGFHQSENVEDRRKEFFDPRTDPVYRDRNEDISLLGGYSSKDLDLTGDEPSTLLGRAAGNTDLDLARIKQIDKQIEFETSIWPDPSETSFPTGPGDLPTRKTDQQIRDEAKEMVK